MTGIQLNYLNYRENQRANRAREGETWRHNRAVEDFNSASLAETSRHNKVGESWTAFSNLEIQRANQARERETNRHNLIVEGIQNYEAETQALHYGEMDALAYKQYKLAKDKQEKELERIGAEIELAEERAYGQYIQNEILYKTKDAAIKSAVSEYASNIAYNTGYSQTANVKGTMDGLGVYDLVGAAAKVAKVAAAG